MLLTERLFASTSLKRQQALVETDWFNDLQVLDKLKNTILPEAKQMLGKVGKGEGSNYPSSIAKVWAYRRLSKDASRPCCYGRRRETLQELETVETEVEGLIRQANDGGDMSNVKSAASG